MCKLAKVAIIYALVLVFSLCNLTKAIANENKIEVILSNNISDHLQEIPLEVKVTNPKTFKIRFISENATINAFDKEKSQWISETSKWDKQIYAENVGKIRILGNEKDEILIIPEIKDSASGEIHTLEGIKVFSKNDTLNYIDKVNQNISEAALGVKNLSEEKAKEIELETKSNTQQINTQNKKQYLIGGIVLLLFGTVTGYIAKKQR